VEDIFGMGAPIALVAGGMPKTLGTPIDETRPLRTAGLSIQPNPFNPSTTISIDVAAPSRVVLRVFDVRGAAVRTLRDESNPPQ
jgi:hypothetical protein